MMTRTSNRLGAVAIGACLLLTGGALASPINDFPDLPFDQVTATTGDFAAFATNSTPIDPPDDPTAGSGQSGVEDSPEPATLTLLGLGSFGAWWHMRRRKAPM